MNKLTQKRLQREADCLIKSGKMPSLKDVCRGPVGRRSATSESADTLIAQALEDGK